MDSIPGLKLRSCMLLSTTNWHLPRACQWLSNKDICQLPLWRENPMQNCWPSATPVGAQGKVRHSVLQGVWWDRMFLGTDFMIAILTSPHIYFSSVHSLSLQHTRLPCPSPTLGARSNSCPSSSWCHPTISSSMSPFPPAFNFSQHQGLFFSFLFFIRVFSNESVLRISWSNFQASASASVFPMNTQDWFPLGWTGWISLQSKGLSRVFSNTTVQKHQFFSVQPSLWSSSQIHTWLLEKL